MLGFGSGQKRVQEEQYLIHFAVGLVAEPAAKRSNRADAAERELVEWKKMKFMADRVGEDFDGLVISVTKYGMFVQTPLEYLGQPIAVPHASEHTGVSIMGQTPIGVMRTILGEVRYVAEDLSCLQEVFDEVFHG